METTEWYIDGDYLKRYVSPEKILRENNPDLNKLWFLFDESNKLVTKLLHKVSFKNYFFRKIFRVIDKAVIRQDRRELIYKTTLKLLSNSKNLPEGRRPSFL